MIGVGLAVLAGGAVAVLLGYALLGEEIRQAQGAASFVGSVSSILGGPGGSGGPNVIRPKLAMRASLAVAGGLVAAAIVAKVV